MATQLGPSQVGRTNASGAHKEARVEAVMLAEVLKVGYAEADSDNNSERSYVSPSPSGPLWCAYGRTNRLRLEEQDEQPASQGERNRGNGIGIVQQRGADAARTRDGAPGAYYGAHSHKEPLAAPRPNGKGRNAWCGMTGRKG